MTSIENLLPTIKNQIDALDTTSVVKLASIEATQGAKELYWFINEVKLALAEKSREISQAVMGAGMVQMFTRYPFLNKLVLDYSTTSEYNDEGGSYLYTNVSIEDSEVDVKKFLVYLKGKGVVGEDTDDLDDPDVRGYLEEFVAYGYVSDNAEVFSDPFKLDSDGWVEGTIEVTYAEMAPYLNKDKVVGLEVWKEVLAKKSL